MYYVRSSIIIRLACRQPLITISKRRMWKCRDKVKTFFFFSFFFWYSPECVYEFLNLARDLIRGRCDVQYTVAVKQWGVTIDARGARGDAIEDAEVRLLKLVAVPRFQS